MKSRTLLWGLALCLALLPVTSMAGTTKTVQVDCTGSNPDSINAALKGKADELIIEITGFCEEHVRIERANVTLRGVDPALDGIQGPTGNSDASALLEVWKAEGVVLENLTIKESETMGLGAWYSSVELINCRVEGNARVGAHFSASTFAPMSDTTFADNAGGGIRCQRNAGCGCDSGCTLTNNGFSIGSGAQGWLEFSQVNDGSIDVNRGQLWLTETDIAGGRVTVVDYGQVLSVGSNVDSGGGNALGAWDYGQIEWTGGQIDGSIRSGWSGLMYLVGVTQASNPEDNWISRSAFLETVTDGPTVTTLTGPTNMDAFATGLFDDGTVLGDLNCSGGADAVCQGTVTKLSSSCGRCP